MRFRCFLQSLNRPACEFQIGSEICCDLSDEFKEVLAQALLGMADKRICNGRIDEAVRNECSGPIEQRDYEQVSMGGDILNA